jgi:hypothetical protein
VNSLLLPRHPEERDSVTWDPLNKKSSLLLQYT